MEARHDAVRIVSPEIDVLAAWLDEMGGTVSRLPVGDLVLWTLRTQTEPWDDGSRAVVLVSVLLLDDESVMPEIVAAVAA
ncbi:hypothetical protein ACIRQP_14730 [Streptomyces sp. NPDC102274]|uniref:hypothetical protein n=1 Tax=Streptomyces sp. NPDC102274 TaxID=3366151 RepID=UPI00382FAD6B